jgi:hypothetical protein
MMDSLESEIRREKKGMIRGLRLNPPIVMMGWSRKQGWENPCPQQWTAQPKMRKIKTGNHHKEMMGMSKMPQM